MSTYKGKTPKGGFHPCAVPASQDAFERFIENRREAIILAGYDPDDCAWMPVENPRWVNPEAPPSVAAATGCFDNIAMDLSHLMNKKRVSLKDITKIVKKSVPNAVYLGSGQLRAAFLAFVGESAIPVRQPSLFPDNPDDLLLPFAQVPIVIKVSQAMCPVNAAEYNIFNSALLDGLDPGLATLYYASDFVNVMEFLWAKKDIQDHLDKFWPGIAQYENLDVDAHSIYAVSDAYNLRDLDLTYYRFNVGIRLQYDENGVPSDVTYAMLDYAEPGGFGTILATYAKDAQIRQRHSGRRHNREINFNREFFGMNPF